MKKLHKDTLIALILNLEEIALTDFLTQLYNRRYFELTVRKLLPRILPTHQRERRSGIKLQSIAILFIDVDHFKTVNDTYGHKMGDEVLKAIAHVLLVKAVKTEGVVIPRFRANDIVARWGGEEFVVCLSGITEDHAIKKAEELRIDIQNYLKRDFNFSNGVTVSIGISEMDKGLSFRGLVNSADQAMREAKSKGRNRVVCASDMIENEDWSEPEDDDPDE